jgi:hypothetical protein
MFLLTETTLFHWDLAFDLLSARLNIAKKEFSGAITLRKVQTWVNKVQTKCLPLQSVGSVGSSHSLAELGTSVSWLVAGARRSEVPVVNMPSMVTAGKMASGSLSLASDLVWWEQLGVEVEKRAPTVDKSTEVKGEKIVTHPTSINPAFLKMFEQHFEKCITN